jgi:hypothetical protein
LAGGTEPGRLLFAALECLGWLGCGSSVFFVLADLAARHHGLIALRALVFVGGLVLAWGSRRATRNIDREMESLRRKWATLPDRPAGPAKARGPEPALPARTLVEHDLLRPATFWGRSRLVQRSPDCLEVVPSLSTWVGGLLGAVWFPLILWLLTWRGLTEPRPWPPRRAAGAYLTLALMQPAAIGFAALGLLLVTRRARIDRGAGEVRLGWLFRDRVACQVGDVVAVQVVRRGVRHLSQVNLVLGGPGEARVNVVTHDYHDVRAQDVLWFGRRLAVFLGVPLVDQLEANAVVSPTELAGLFAPDWLAGPHNAKLTEPGDGVLELRPVPQRGAPLSGVWGGWPFHRACAAVKFDRTRGHPPRLFVRLLPGSGLGGLPGAFRKPRPLQDVAAVELAADTGDRPDFPEGTSRPTCRLRLLLRDANHPVLELAPHADEAWARETGGRLAPFLGVPLEDRARPEKP